MEGTPDGHPRHADAPWSDDPDQMWPPELQNLDSDQRTEVGRRFIAIVRTGLRPTLEQIGQIADDVRLGSEPIPYERRRPREDAPGQVVYYLAFGDRIKIGTTSNLARRLLALPHDEVLAIEPGGYAVERRRHLQFSADRITPRGEWFHRSPELLAHIRALRERAA